MGNSFPRAPGFYWNSALCECLKNTKKEFFVLFLKKKVNTAVDNCPVFSLFFLVKVNPQIASRTQVDTKYCPLSAP